VLDRASIFSNPDVVKLLQTKFVPVAIDQAYQRRQKDAEGRFYQKIANQGPRKVGGGTTQGHYVAAPDGTLLGFGNHRATERFMGLLRGALNRYRGDEVAAIDPGRPDSRWSPKPPAGGLIVRVHSKVLSGYEPTDDPWRRMFQNGIGRDNLWIRTEEHRALIRGEIPQKLLARIAMFHLVDNTRGEPPMWEPQEIVSSDATLRDGRLSGTVHLRSRSGDREFKADIFGMVETKDGRISRLDLVARGQFRGEGQFTQRAPKGEFPLAIAFRLADGTDVADSIPPQASRGWLDGYIR